MPRNANAPTWGRGAAEKFSGVCTARCTTSLSRGTPKNQDVVTFAQRNERMLWRDFQQAVEALDNDATPETRLLKKLAFRKWRDIYLSLP